MKSLLINIFSSFKFLNEEFSSDALFFFPEERQQVEYYLVYFVTKETLNTFLTSESFAEVLDAFHRKRPIFNDIDKNTSLILCVQMDDLRADCMRFKYDMLKVEENDFQFKNYVLPYTVAALSAFSSLSSFPHDLNSKINSESAFEHYFTDPYGDEGYFLAIQLFLKLSFLGPFPTQNISFQPIDQLMAHSVASSHLQFFFQIAKSERFMEIDWDAVQRNALNPTSEEFDKFLLNFKINGN